MKPVRGLFDDWGVKFLALLLAWGLWFAVREDLDEQRAARLTLELRPTPGCGIEGEVLTSHVAVKLRGPRREVDMLVTGSRALLVPVRAEDLTVDQLAGVREVVAQDLLLPEPLPPDSVRILEMDPPTVSVRLWRIERREIPIRTPEFPGAEEFGVQVDRKSWPEKAVVRGPAEDLARLQSLDASVRREDLRRAVAQMGEEPRVQTTLALQLTNVPTRDFTVIEPRLLEVQADLVRVGGAQVTLPLVILDDAGASGDRLRVEPSEFQTWLVAGDPVSVRLDLRGSPRALASVTPETVRAFVLRSEMPADQDRADLRIHLSDLPRGVALARDRLTATVVRAR